jgi:hypothetical protein
VERILWRLPIVVGAGHVVEFALARLGMFSGNMWWVLSASTRMGASMVVSVPTI